MRALREITALVLLATLVCAGHRGGGRYRGGYDYAALGDANGVLSSRPCGHQIMKQLENCCRLPRLIPPSVLQGCFTSECGSGWGWWDLGSVGSGSGSTTRVPATGFREDAEGGGGVTENMPLRKGAQLGGKGGKYRHARDTPVQEGEGEGEETKEEPYRPGGNIKPAAHRGGGFGFGFGMFGGRMGRGGGGRGAFLCVMECAFRNQSLLTSAGEVDTAAAKDKFTAAAASAGDAWQQHLTSALQNCTAELAKTNLTNWPVSGTASKTCKPGPALYMTCIRRYLAVNCPENSVVTSDGYRYDRCPAMMNFLRTCDPFAPCVPQGGGGGGVLGSVFPMVFGRGGGRGGGGGGGGRGRGDGDVETVQGVNGQRGKMRNRNNWN